MKLRRIASLVRKTIIVVLALAAVGVGVPAATGFYVAAAAYRCSMDPQRITLSIKMCTSCGHLVSAHGRSCSRADEDPLDSPFLKVEENWEKYFRDDPRVSVGNRLGSRTIGVFWGSWGLSMGVTQYEVGISPLIPICLFALYPTIAFIRGPLRRHRRRKRGLCIHCGFDLRGTPERCPECGHER